MELLTRLEARRYTIRPDRYDPRELAGLPEPVQHYFRTALRPGQPMIAAVTLEHTGSFNTGKRGERWREFTSTQRVVTSRPGFDWDARIRLLPGLAIRVHDAYAGGEGILTAHLLGLPLLKRQGTPELARGELMRFLAEATWYPTALLPSQGVRWSALDDTTARADFADAANHVSLTFGFSTDGRVESVRAEDRPRTVRDRTVPTPWEGRWSHYAGRDGMQVPLEGEAAWLLPDGRKPYWRGRVTRLAYELA